MKWLWFGIMLCVLCVPSRAQQNVIEDIQESLTSKPKLIVGFNNRNSLFGGEPVKMRGLQAGIDYDKIFKVTLGFNWMPKTQRDVRYDYLKNVVDTINSSHQMQFLSLTAEYVFHQTKKWRFSAPVSIGIGNYKRLTSHTHKFPTSVAKNTIVPIEFGATGMYYITDWFGVKAGLGNRLSFGKNFGSTSGPYYSFGFVLLIQPLLGRVRGE